MYKATYVDPYVDHETGEIYETKALVIEAYRGGHQIDLYT